ncbi:MAG: tRNA (guanosine(46)-N7)-methyltransferase TrmB [Rickettsiales bacterium]|nr:tRNA (guanosine(46)-N7)-methyltransferase TrmB [Rickettsiales bacterium]
MESIKTKYKIASFTKRGTRKLSQRKKFLRDEIFPNYQLNENKIEEIKKFKGKINLEIGFGSGEFLFSLAKANQDQLFIGCEPFETGVLQLIDKIHTNNLTNIFILADDVFPLLEKLPNDFFNSIYVLFPDPWPKSKHHKRRIISHNNLDIFSAKLKTNANLKVATDHYDYASWIIAHLINRSDLSWDHINFLNIYEEFPEYIITKYYRKAKSDQKFFFNFIKKET